MLCVTINQSGDQISRINKKTCTNNSKKNTNLQIPFTPYEPSQPMQQISDFSLNFKHTSLFIAFIILQGSSSQ